MADSRQSALDLTFATERLNWSSSSFKYVPIENDQIRVLQLMPGEGSERINCKIFINDFGEAATRKNSFQLTYEALSYTWGDPHSKGCIYIENQRVEVRENLEAALRRLRYKGYIRPIWVDAISINQDDHDEKGTQIELMRHIYGNATTVNVWLGEHADGSEVVMTIFQALDQGKLLKEQIAALITMETEQPIHKSIAAFFNRQYWKRVWIIQELVCAKDAVVLCGNSTVPFSAILNFHQSVNEVGEACHWPNVARDITLRTVPSPYITEIDSLKTFRDRSIETSQSSSPEKLNTLAGLLYDSPVREATDPRDRIYALLGIMDDINNNNACIPVDYNLTVEQLYIDVAKYLVVLRNSLAMFSQLRPNQSRRTKYRLPSWCPDWSLELPQPTPLIAFLDSDTNVRVAFADRESADATFECVENSHHMSVTGVTIDTLAEIGGEFNFDHLHWYQWLWFSAVGESSHASRNTDSGFDVGEEESLDLSDDLAGEPPTEDLSELFLRLLAPRKMLNLANSYGQSEQREIEQWVQVSQMGNPALAAQVEIGGEMKYAGSLICQRTFLSNLVEAVPRIAEDSFISARIRKLWQTLIFSERIEWVDDENATFDSMFRCLLGWAPPPDGDLATNELQKIARYTRPIRRAIARASTGCTFFVTAKGNIGIAPLGAKKGDVVCVLYGCLYPVFLRPKAKEFEVVGVGYLHGYAAGKAVQEMKEGILKERKFVLV